MRTLHFRLTIPVLTMMLLSWTLSAFGQGKPDIRWMKGLGAGDSILSWISYSDDGLKLIRVVGQTIQVSSASDGRVLRTLVIRPQIGGCGISTDGTRAAVSTSRPKQGGGTDYLVQLYDLDTGTMIWEVGGQLPYSRFRFVVGNSIIAAWNPDTTYRAFLKTSDGKPAYAVNPIISATPQFSPNGLEMAVNDGQTFNNKVHFYDLANGGVEVRSWLTSGWGILPYSPDAASVLDRAGYYSDSPWRVRAASNGAILNTFNTRTFQPGGGYFYDAAWPSNTAFLAPGANDPTGNATKFYGLVDRFDLLTGARSEFISLDVRTSWATLLLSPDKSTLALGANGTGGMQGVNYLRFYDPSTGAETRREEGHGAAVFSAAYHPNGRIIATAGWDNTFKLWDRLTGSLQRTIETDYPAVKAHFSPDGKLLVGVYTNGGAQARIWNTADYAAPPVTLPTGNDAAVSFDNKYAVAVGGNYYYICRASDGVTLNGGGFPSVAAAACSPKANIGATAGGYSGFNYQVNLLDLATGSVLWWGSVGFYPTAAQFTQDGTKLIVAGRGGVAAIKVAGATSSVLWTKTFPDSTNYRLGVEPCGRYVITGFDSTVTAEPGKLVIFRMSDGAVVKTYDDETGYRQWFGIYGAGWSPDGESIAYTRWDGLVVEAKNPFYDLPKLSALAAPASLAGGAVGTGTVTLTCPAPVVEDGQYIDGAVVTLKSSDTSLLQVRANMTVPGAQEKGTFQFTTAGVTADTTVTITATYNGVSKSKIVKLVPPALSKVAVTPTSVISGAGAIGTVTLTGAPAAGTGGIVVTLSSSQSFVTVRSSVTVPEGETSASFNITTTGVSAISSATISASFNSINKTASLTVKPATLSSIKLSPTTVKGGVQTSTGTVTLSGVAPPGGFTVTLSTSNTAVAQTPGNVVVPEGQSSWTFTVTTSAVSAKTSVKVLANGGAKSATLTVTP